MAVGSKNLTPEQLRGLEDGPLADALAEAKKERRRPDGSYIRFDENEKVG